jgi:hypothetical protein
MLLNLKGVTPERWLDLLTIALRIDDVRGMLGPALGAFHPDQVEVLRDVANDAGPPRALPKPGYQIVQSTMHVEADPGEVTGELFETEEDGVSVEDEPARSSRRLSPKVRATLEPLWQACLSVANQLGLDAGLIERRSYALLQNDRHVGADAHKVEVMRAAWPKGGSPVSTKGEVWERPHLRAKSYSIHDLSKFNGLTQRGIRGMVTRGTFPKPASDDGWRARDVIRHACLQLEGRGWAE